MTKPGTKVQLELIQDGKKKEVTVELGEFEKSAQAQLAVKEESDLGMTIQNITPELAKYFNLKQTERVIVIDVKPDSPAGKAGIQKGDVILGVNRKKVSDTNDFRKAIKVSPKGAILLMINRDGHPLYTVITR